MLYGDVSLGYKVLSEVIVNGSSVVLISENVEGMQTEIYQVIYGCQPILNTLNPQEAKTLFDKKVKELISNI